MPCRPPTRLADDRRLSVQRRGQWRLGSPTGTCTYLSGRLREPARAEPPPPTRSTTKQPPFSESSTSLEPPLTRDWRGRQIAGSGPRAAPPETDLGSARAFQARDTRRSGHVARRLRPRGRCCSCLRVTEGRRR